jgi:hypothetical protein
MTVQEVEKALQNSGRIDIQIQQQDYSKWSKGADTGISATYKPEHGIELWELYVFAERQGEGAAHRTLSCMGFAADSSAEAETRVTAMLGAKYGMLHIIGDVQRAGDYDPREHKVWNIRNQALFDIIDARWEEKGQYFSYISMYTPMYTLQTKRTFGVFSVLTSWKYTKTGTEAKNPRIDLTLIPAEDNVAEPFMGFVRIAIKGTDVNLRDRPGMQGRVLAQASGQADDGYVIMNLPPVENDNYPHDRNYVSTLIADAIPIRGSDNSTWYKLVFSFKVRYTGTIVFRKIEVGSSSLYVHADFVKILPFRHEAKKCVEDFINKQPR